MPTVTYSFLCEDAQLRGTVFDITAIGIEEIVAPKFPSMTPRLVYFARLHFFPNELSDHKVTLKVSDEDGNLLGPPAETTVTPEKKAWRTKGVNTTILTIPKLTVTKPGSISITLFCGGQLLDQIDLDIIPQPSVP